eukprot:evm.model.scf_841EXC.7 EVM.evm.TU.scf_841EXC.7   scf_841EXC:48893-54188(+)
MAESPHRRSPSSLNLQWDSKSSLKRAKQVCYPTSEDTSAHVFYLCDLLEEVSCLHDLWQRQQLCDVVLRTGDGGLVGAHKIVLASCSPFFRALFTGTGQSMREHQQRLTSGQSVVDLLGVDSAGLERVLGAVYARKLEVSPENLEILLSCSNQLEVLPVQEVCCQYLRRCMQPENCLQVLQLAERYNCVELEQEVLHYVCGKFSDVLQLPHWEQSIGQLSKSLLLEVLRSDDISVDSELQVLEAGLAWIKSDLFSRQADFPDILASVRIALLPRELVVHEAHLHGLSSSVVSASMMSCSSPSEQSDCTHDKWCGVVDESASDWAAVPRRRSPTGLMVAGGHDAEWRSLKIVEEYSPHRDEWSPGQSMTMSFSFTGAAPVPNGVLVVGGTMYSANVCRYDNQRRQWFRCPPLLTPRVHSAVASMSGFAYVLGGRTGVGQELCGVEWFDSSGSSDKSDGKWCQGPDMLEPRCALGAGAIGGHLYAVGGQASRTVHNSAESLDPERGQWSLVSARLGSMRKYVAVGVLGGRLYAVGGMNEQRVRLPTMEAYDPREGRWQLLGSMHVARSSCGVAAFQDKLYAVGGNAGDDQIHETVECYLPETNQWVPCASMGCGRSGLSVVAH